MIFGVVLAGGRSRRFGREKAMAELGGRPLIAHVADVLSAGCAHLAVNAQDGSGAAAFARTRGLPVLTDAPHDPNGPLAGVKAGLIWAGDAGAERLATSPCDTPFLPLDLIARLASAGPPERPVIAYTSQGLQPLCALWPTRLADDIGAIIATGQHPSMKTLLEAFDPVTVLFNETWRFDNLNTPDDYGAALARQGGYPA